MITLEKVKDNKDPLRQGRVLTENGDWLYPICGFGEDSYGWTWVPPPGAIAMTLNKQYYIGTSWVPPMKEKNDVAR